MINNHLTSKLKELATLLDNWRYDNLSEIPSLISSHNKRICFKPYSTNSNSVIKCYGEYPRIGNQNIHSYKSQVLKNVDNFPTANFRLSRNIHHIKNDLIRRLITPYENIFIDALAVKDKVNKHREHNQLLIEILKKISVNVRHKYNSCTDSPKLEIELDKGFYIDFEIYYSGQVNLQIKNTLSFDSALKLTTNISKLLKNKEI